MPKCGWSVKPMEMFHLIINIIALTVNVGLVFFAGKLLSVFRGSVMGRPWMFVALGVLSLATGSTLFSVHYLLNLGGFEVHAAGGLLMLTGGVFALIGIYLQYKSWTVQT